MGPQRHGIYELRIRASYVILFRTILNIKVSFAISARTRAHCPGRIARPAALCNILCIMIFSVISQIN